MLNLRVYALTVLLAGQVPAATVESGKFRLHKFEQAIGEESYQVASDGELLVLDSKFSFEDRGTRVALSAFLRTRADGTPLRFELKGSTSRISRIDSSVEIAGDRAWCVKPRRPETRQRRRAFSPSAVTLRFPFR